MALLVSLLGATYSPSPVQADSAENEYGEDERHTPIAAEVTLSIMPAVGQQAGVTIIVSSPQPAPGTEVNVVTSDGVRIDGPSHFAIDLAAGEPHTLISVITPLVAGNHSVSANVIYSLGDGNSWGDTAAAYFHSGDGSSSINFSYQGNPTSGGASPGPYDTETATIQAYSDGTLAALAVDDHPPAPADDAVPGEKSVEPDDTVRAAGLLTIRGTAGYWTDTGWVNQILLVELLDGNGNHIAYTYSGWDGTYHFMLANPGKFQLRFWAYYYHGSQVAGALRVIGDGDISGPFDVSGYNYTVGTYGPYQDGVDVNVGYWQPDVNWNGRRAFWILQSLVQGFFYPWSHVPPGVEPGSRLPDGVTVKWFPGSTVGAFYSQSTRKIQLTDVDANSPHTILHEYGHAIMDNVYRQLGSSMPRHDCPSPHYVESVSGRVCAWTEGWANFYAIAVLDDPVYKWGCALPCTPPSVDLENRRSVVAFDSGDLVEGNVAASMWDFIDGRPDGWDMTNVATTPFWRLWDTFYTQTDDDFNDFIWYLTSYHNMNNVLATLYQNSIDYGWEQCGDWYMEPDNDPSQAHWHHPNNYHPYTLRLCTDYDTDFFQFYATPGKTYTIWTLNLSTSGNGTLTDTTLELYGTDGVTFLAYDDNGGDSYLASKIVFTATTEGWHYVAVRQANGKGDLAYRYDIDFAESPAT
jgi:hypothetical protein